MKKVRQSVHRLDIKPCAHIHDAQYYLVRDGAYDSLVYINTHLPKEVAWQEDPEISHPEIKLSGSCEIFYPNWNHGVEIPNGADVPTIKEKIRKHLADLAEKGIKV